MTRRNFNESDIHLFLDGEMPEEDRPAFDAWCRVHPEAQALSQRFSSDREQLRQALAGVTDEPVPPHLQVLVHGGEGRRFRSRPWLQAAAAAVILAIGTIGGYFTGLSQAGPPSLQRTFVDNAIQAHDMYAAEKLHVVEVKADQRDHLLGWLSKRVGVHLVAPDLTAQGYELVGGRLLPDSGKAAAQFMYQNATGDRVSLYVTREPERAQTGFKSMTEGTTNAFYWMDDDYGCAVSGGVTDKTLASIADTTYRQYLAAEAQ